MGAGDHGGNEVVHAHPMLTPGQYADLTRMIENAERMSGLAFSVYVGGLPNGRTSALERHATLADPDGTVLVAVDPDRRMCEVVTGERTRVGLTDHACHLAVLSMTSGFAVGDLMGGLRDGMVVLGEQGHVPPVLHLDTP